MANKDENITLMEVDTKETKVADSAYSKSYTNSDSHTSAYTKSLLSRSDSTGSSGYCGNDESAAAPINKVSLTKRKKHKLMSNKGASKRGEIVSPLYVGKNEPSGRDASTLLEALDLQTRPEKHVNNIATFDQNFKETSLQDKFLMGQKININGINCKVNKQSSHAENDEQSEDGFRCVISMYDGVILYATPSLTKTLGFSTSTWIGRNFTDFVHPKDRDTFSNQIVTGIVLPLTNGIKKQDAKSSFYVCLKRRRKQCEVRKIVQYQAFHLTVTYRRASDCNLGDSNDTFLVVVAVPAYSAYKVPDEVCGSSKFRMRHTAGCTFSHVDSEVVTNFGYLPQDMLGKSVFDFYHPDDLPCLKQIYETVMSKCQVAGSVYKSKPYRFAIHNGDFVTVETEWSSFVNPWSRRLEFVIGLNSILQGPGNIDVFGEPSSKNVKTVPKEAGHIKDDIMALLSKEFHERDDPVPLCEISPHCNGEDRDSSENEPSYNQLNYNDNIVRFFNSKPKTNPTGCKRATLIADEKNSSATNCKQKCVSPAETSGASGSDSARILSSKKALNGNSYKSLCLTEELLNKHNQDMEKIMLEQHRNRRTKRLVKRGTRTELLNKRGGKRSVTTQWNCPHNCKLRKYDDDALNCRVAKDSTCQLVTPTFSNFPASGMIPLYYIQPQLHCDVSESPVNMASPLPFPVQYVPGAVICNSVFAPQTFVCPPVVAASRQPAPALEKASEYPGTGSRATSVKAEPGSVIGSVKSASMAANKEVAGYQKDAVCLVEAANRRDFQWNSNSKTQPCTDSPTSKNLKSQDESSSFSLLSSSFFRTSYTSESRLEANDDSNSDDKQNHQDLTKQTKRFVPPWMEGIDVTPDFVYTYQLPMRNSEEILLSNIKALRNMDQPALVNDQLDQLYVELELSGFSPCLILDEVANSTSSTNEDCPKPIVENETSSIMMIYESDAPLPSPMNSKF